MFVLDSFLGKAFPDITYYAELLLALPEEQNLAYLLQTFQEAESSFRELGEDA
jgi:hypothetical protein